MLPLTSCNIKEWHIVAITSNIVIIYLIGRVVNFGIPFGSIILIITNY